MPIIKDKYHKLVINLATDINITSPQTILLDVYKKNNLDEDTLVGTFTPTITSDGYKFDVPFSDSRFTIRDNLSKFVVRLGGTYNLYDLHEGVSIVVDGVETSVKQVLNNTVQTDTDNEPITEEIVRNPQFALSFADNNVHTVRAVFKGNKEMGVAVSDPLTIQVQQRDDSSALQAGKYVLEIIRLPKTIKYMEQPNWQWRLTKGGIGVADVGATDIPVTSLPAGGKTIEIVLPPHTNQYNSIASIMSNSEGYISLTSRTEGQLKGWEVGKYKIGAKFYHYDEVEEGGVILTQVWKDIEVVKNNPSIAFRKAGTKGKSARFTLKNPLGTGIANKKLTIKVGSKSYIKTTNSNGNVFLAINNKGHFKYTVTYAGDKNLNKITKTFEETIG